MIDPHNIEQQLKDNGFDKEDLLIYMAKIVPKSAELNQGALYIKRNINGILETLRKNNGIYTVIDIIPRKVHSGETREERSERLLNHVQYNTLPTPTYDKKLSNKQDLFSENRDRLLFSLQENSIKGLLKVFKIC